MQINICTKIEGVERNPLMINKARMVTTQRKLNVDHLQNNPMSGKQTTKTKLISGPDGTRRK